VQIDEERESRIRRQQARRPGYLRSARDDCVAGVERRDLLGVNIDCLSSSDGITFSIPCRFVGTRFHLTDVQTDCLGSADGDTISISYRIAGMSFHLRSISIDCSNGADCTTSLSPPTPPRAPRRQVDEDGTTGAFRALLDELKAADDDDVVIDRKELLKYLTVRRWSASRCAPGVPHGALLECLTVRFWSALRVN
jgi:hypothetical protein